MLHSFPTRRSSDLQFDRFGLERDSTGWTAKAGTTFEFSRKLNGEISAILALADVREVLARQGLSPAGGEPERLSRLVGTELERWRRVIAQAKIRAD